MHLAKRELRVSLDRASPSIDFDVLQGEVHLKGPVRIANISRNGMFLELQGEQGFDVPPGSSLHFSMRFAGSREAVTGVAKVRWVRSKELGPYQPRGLGVQVIEFHENTERSYLQLLESSLMNLKVTDLMDSVPATIAPDAPATEAAAELAMTGIDVLIVVDGNERPIGLLTAKDLLAASVKGVLSGRVAKDFLSGRPTLVSADAGTDEIYSLLRYGGPEHLIVVEDDILIGLIRTSDLVPFWTELMELRAKRFSHNYDRAMSLIAHDLRSPLGTIKTTNLLLTSGELDPMEYVQSGFPEVLDATCDTMLALIDDLLDLDQIRSGVVRLKKESVDLEELLEKVSRCYGSVALAKDITIDVDVAAAVPRVLADPLRLEQILGNLVSNALKFSPPGSHVVLGLKGLHSQVAIWVADDGPGIPPQEQSDIFAEYRRGSVRPTSGEPSTGLGLAIVKKLVEAHGGEIRLESTLGEGTTFTVFLPIGDLQ